MSNSKHEELKDTGRGAVGKTAVAGMKDRETNETRAMAVKDTNKQAMHPFIRGNVDEDTAVYTDDAPYTKPSPLTMKP
ncbi:MAG: transposase [Gammaproteobacteria bacterium]|nr:transposase [Gammaproteobacteria bacterium]